MTISEERIVELAQQYLSKLQKDNEIEFETFKPGVGEEQVKVFVTLKENKTLVLEELRLFCEPIMSQFMVPEVFEVLKEMPRTETGKPSKAELQKRQ